jgi:curved DNA-binding protein CbpA
MRKMILQEQALLERARKVLGVINEDGENEIKYAYYRLMFQHHPDRNPDDPTAHEKTALVNEAFFFLTGKRHDALLLKQDSLVSAVSGGVVTELEGVLSYEEWLLKQFYDVEGKSIYAC